MIDRLKLRLSFDPPRMVHDLSRLGQTDWIEHFVKQNYDGDWSVIPLRGPAGAQHPVMMIYSDPSCREFADTPFVKQCPYFHELLSSFACPLQAVRLMKLASGSIIKTHTDHDLSFEDGSVRLHIPVITNPDVEFLLNGTSVVMNEGECWYLRLSDPHSVANRGQTARVHLVIDATVNPWLKDIFTEAEALE